MKKFAVALAILALSSSVAMAADLTTDQTNGKASIAYPASQAVIIDTLGYADTTAPREGTLPEIWGNQSVVASIPAQAFIPCYLEMKFQGNDTNTLLQVWGKDQTISDPSTSTMIAFHPNVGGYVDSNWAYIGNSTTSLAEVGIDAAWVRACDTFRTIIWSNDDYKYTVGVSNDALTGVNHADGHTLRVDMRAAKKTGQQKDETWAFGAVSASDWLAVDLASGEKTLFNGGNHNTQTTVYQQFRVPFGSGVMAGQYNGTITFTAATI